MLTKEMKAKVRSAIALHAEGLKRLQAMWLDEKVLFYDDPLDKCFERLREKDAGNEARAASSVFLAGPTSRHAVPDYLWRKDAHYYLRKSGYTGYILVPEFRGQSYLQNTFKADFTNSEYVYEWERSLLRACEFRMFWIPRDDGQLLALTTNRELGQWLGIAEYDETIAGNLFVGWPKGTKHMGSIEFEMKSCKKPITWRSFYSHSGSRIVFDTLSEMCSCISFAFKFDRGVDTSTFGDAEDRYGNWSK